MASVLCVNLFLSMLVPFSVRLSCVLASECFRIIICVPVFVTCMSYYFPSLLDLYLVPEV